MAKLIEATYGDALFELAVEESRVDSLYDEAGEVRLSIRAVRLTIRTDLQCISRMTIPTIMRK